MLRIAKPKSKSKPTQLSLGTREMIPVKYSSKLGIYENIKIHNNTLKVRVVDNPGVLPIALSELKSEMGSTTVVGIGVDPDASYNQPATTLICGEKYCLVIQLIHMDLESKVPDCLKDFLEDREICFVGNRKSRAALYRLTEFGVKCSGDVLLDHLVAKFLKKPSLLPKRNSYGVTSEVAVTTLATEVGVVLDRDQKKQSGDYSGTSLDFDAIAFSDEDIKKIVSDVYALYLIGSKVLGSL